MGSPSPVDLPPPPSAPWTPKLPPGSGRGGGPGDSGGGDEIDDQTPRLPRTATELGTGLLLVRGARAPEKHVLRDIAHDYLVSYGRAQKALAVKWLATSVATPEEIESSDCGSPPARCTKTCVRPGCICDHTRGICL